MCYDFSMSKTWKSLFSDLFVNLSAGWFGAALIVPTFSDSTLIGDLWILTYDLILGTLFLVLSYVLRKNI